MTERQKFALSNPIDPRGTADLVRFTNTVVKDGRKFDTTLTVDRIKEDFFWHVSVAVLGVTFKPIFVRLLTETDHRAAFAVARAILMGVGRPNFDEMIRQSKTMQIRRKLTLEELRGARPRVDKAE